MPQRHVLGLVAGSALAAAACSSLLGIGDIAYDSRSDAGLDATDATATDAGDADGDAGLSDFSRGCAAYDAFFCADFDQASAVGFAHGVEVALSAQGTAIYLTRQPPAVSAPNALRIHVPSHPTPLDGAGLHVTFGELWRSYHLSARVRYETYSIPSTATAGDGYAFTGLTFTPEADAGTRAPCSISYGIGADGIGGAAGALTALCPDYDGGGGTADQVTLPTPGPTWHVVTWDVTLDGVNASVTLNTGADTRTRVFPWPSRRGSLELYISAVSKGRVSDVIVEFDDVVVTAE